VHAARHPQAVGPVAPLPGQHYVKGCGAQECLGVGPSVGPLYGAVIPLEDAAKEFLNLTVGVDDQQVAGTQDISVH
jgi:hypothetical protein